MRANGARAVTWVQPMPTSVGFPGFARIESLTPRPTRPTRNEHARRRRSAWNVLRTRGRSGTLRGVARTVAVLALVALLGGEGHEPPRRPGGGDTLAPAHLELAISQPNAGSAPVAAAVLRRLGTRELAPRGAIGVTARPIATHGVEAPRSKWRRLARMGLDGDH